MMGVLEDSKHRSRTSQEGGGKAALPPSTHICAAKWNFQLFTTTTQIPPTTRLTRQ